MKKKFYSLLLVFIFVFSSVGVVSAQVQPDDNHSFLDGVLTINDLFEYEGFAQLELEAALSSGFTAERLMNQNRSFMYVDALFDSMPRNRADEIIFPEYFGGIYLDSDGNLVITVVESAFADVRSGDIMRASELDGISIRLVEFSHSELLDTIERLIQITPSELAYGECLGFSWWLSERDNRVVVGLFDYGDEQIAWFRESVLDCATIIFEHSSSVQRYDEILDDAYVGIEPFVILNPNINPGRRIYINGGRLSVGFRVRSIFDSRDVGFVTSPHGRAAWNADVRVDSLAGSTVGRVEGQVFSGGVDAAFVRLTNIRYAPTNVLPPPIAGNLVPVTRIPIQGSIIFQVGATHAENHPPRTGLMSAEVVSTNASTRINNVLLHSLIRVIYPHNIPGPTVGDSGGAVWNPDRTAAGLHAGSFRAQDGTIFGYSVRAGLVLNALSVEMY